MKPWATLARAFQIHQPGAIRRRISFGMTAKRQGLIIEGSSRSLSSPCTSPTVRRPGLRPAWHEEDLYDGHGV